MVCVGSAYSARGNLPQALNIVAVPVATGGQQELAVGAKLQRTDIAWVGKVAPQATGAAVPQPDLSVTA